MTADGDRTRRRRPRTELSDRQRRVLDLLAAGKTNGEIAADLGVSLDGAKYHVREVCDFVGVDTREEAAEWWRQQRGLRARFTVARHGLARMPALVRWGLAGGAALAVAAVAIFAIWPRDDERAGLDPGVWVALPVPVAPAESPEWLAQMRVISVATGEERDVDEPGAWYWPSLSPSGERLYALEVPDGPSSNVLHLFDLENGSETVAIPWERTYAPETAVWSPDGTRLAITTTDWAGVLQPDGVLHGEQFRPEPETGTAAANACAWTPDSTRYLCDAGKQGDWVVIVDREGELLAYLEGAQLAPPPLDTRQRLAMSTHFAWTGVDEIELTASTVDESGREVRTWRFLGSLDHDLETIAWGSATELTEAEGKAIEEKLLARHQEVAAGHGILGGSVSSIRVSRDGEFAGAFIAEGQPVARSGEGSEVTFVTFVDGERFAYPLGYLERPATAYLFIAWDMVRVE